MVDLIGQESKKPYIYDRMHDREGEDVVLLSVYIEQRRDELVALLEAYLATSENSAFPSA